MTTRSTANFSLLRAAYRSRHRIFNPGSSGQDLPGLPKPSVWCDKPWEIDALSPSVEMPIDYSQWPDEDLAEKLIKAYFDWDNLLLPLLNRVHFKRDYYALRWRDDREFARLCLCVFAIASPRITGSDRNSVQDGENSAIEQHSAGWHWIKSVMRTSAATLKPATLVSLQVQTASSSLGDLRKVSVQSDLCIISWWGTSLVAEGLCWINGVSSDQLSVAVSYVCHGVYLKFYALIFRAIAGYWSSQTSRNDSVSGSADYRIL